jgi:glycosyltransferase involved in cell wall biosynthesis
LKILIVVPWDQERGGVATVVNKVAECLNAKGHSVLFFHPEDLESLAVKKTKAGFRGCALNLRAPFIAECPVRSIVAFLFTLPRTLLQLLVLLRKEEIDVVNVHYPIPAFVYFALCRVFHRFVLVVSAHGSDLRPGGRRPQRQPWSVRILVRLCDRLTAPSRRYLNDILVDFPAARERAVAVHNGIDVAEFSDLHHEQSTLEPYILCVASHNEVKGVDVLLRAIAGLRERGDNTPVVLAGDGPLRTELEELTKRLGIESRVHFAGFQDLEPLRALLQMCTFVVLPSRGESFGIAILEGMAAGKPVVATRVGGVPEIVIEGETGLLVPPVNEYALCAAMSKLLRSRELQLKLGRAGRARALEHFTADRMAERYEAVFAEAVAGYVLAKGAVKR